MAQENVAAYVQGIPLCEYAEAIGMSHQAHLEDTNKYLALVDVREPMYRVKIWFAVQVICNEQAVRTWQHLHCFVPSKPSHHFFVCEILCHLHEVQKCCNRLHCLILMQDCHRGISEGSRLQGTRKDEVQSSCLPKPAVLLYVLRKQHLTTAQENTLRCNFAESRPNQGKGVMR